MAEGVAQRPHDNLAVARVENVGVARDVAEQTAEVRRRRATVVIDDRAYRVVRAWIVSAAVGVDLADAQAICPVPLREQLAPTEEAVVAELEPGDGAVAVEVEQEVARVSSDVVLATKTDIGSSSRSLSKTDDATR